MKKRMFKKRMIALILSLVMVVGITCHVSALEPSPSAVPTPESSSNDGTAYGNSNQEKLAELGLEEEDFFITVEVARYIAEFFIRDMVATGNTVWDDNTSIVEIVPMYDETGENIVAYSAELTEGYITISAYIDMPSLILEWADEATPVYKEMKQEAPVAYSANSYDSKIIYLGGLGYFVDDGSDVLESIDGIEVSRSDLSENLSQYRNVKNVNGSVLTELAESKNRNQQGAVTYANDNEYGGYISNVFTYAHNVYGGTWKSTDDWKNYWESYVKNIATMYDFANYSEHCGPVAITNLIKMYGAKHNISSITSKSNKQIFDKVIEANNSFYVPIYYNNIYGGTTDSEANQLIEKSFSMFGVNIQTYGLYKANLSNVRNAVGTSNRLMYLCLNYGKLYGHHAVAAYAYCKIQNESGDLRAFIKICDGKNYAPRYVDISTTSANDYWEVYLPQ